MFGGVPVIQAEVLTSMPAKQREARADRKRHTPRFHHVDSFLEGPSFDREGNLWLVGDKGFIVRVRRE